METKREKIESEMRGEGHDGVLVMNQEESDTKYDNLLPPSISQPSQLFNTHGLNPSFQRPIYKPIPFDDFYFSLQKPKELLNHPQLLSK